MIHIRILLLASLALWALPGTGRAEGQVDYDTTRVRRPEPVKNTMGEIIADIPGEILKLPIYTTEVVGYGLVTIPPYSSALSLIKLGKGAAPYVPIIGYSNRAGIKVGFGLRLLNTKSREGQLKLKWSYSTHDYQSYKLQYRTADRFVAGSSVHLYARYKNRPRESFYGVGMDTDASREVSYALEDTEFRIRIIRKLGKRLGLAIHSRYKHTNITDGREYA